MSQEDLIKTTEPINGMQLRWLNKRNKILAVLFSLEKILYAIKKYGNENNKIDDMESGEYQVLNVHIQAVEKIIHTNASYFKKKDREDFAQLKTRWDREMINKKWDKYKDKDDVKWLKKFRNELNIKINWITARFCLYIVLIIVTIGIVFLISSCGCINIDIF